jgi:solute carrier family 25 carnitine/acylcarnitine transporter 20/29
MYHAIHIFLNNPEMYQEKLSQDTLSPSKPSKPSNSMWQYYIKGAIAGMTGIILSHPVDTVKTHIQTGRALRDFKPGLSNLYKGLLPPLAGVGLEKAIVFGTYNYFNKQLDNIPLAGAISGFSAAVIVTPYERLKILKQNNIGINKAEINMKFLFRGLGATWTREVPGFAIYFSVYEALKHTNHTQHGREIGLHNSFFYGGIAGVAAWIFIYPQDRIKTILQSSYSAGNGNSVKSIMLEIYNKGGMKHFYSGFSWAVARAILLHSGTFCMMEFLSKQF